MTKTVEVPIQPTDAMREAMTGQTPYLSRRKMDKSGYEVIRQDHPEWRDVVAEPMTVVAEYSNGEEAAEHCERLAFEWRYAEMLKAVRP